MYNGADFGCGYAAKINAPELLEQRQGIRQAAAARHQTTAQHVNKLIIFSVFAPSRIL